MSTDQAPRMDHSCKEFGRFAFSLVHNDIGAYQQHLAAQSYHDWALLQHWLQLMVSCASAVRMAASCAYLSRPFALGLRRGPLS